jgi:hypothetical protein
MSTLGRQPMASFVKFVLATTWWAVATGLGLLVILLACSFFIEIRSNNLTMSLPVAVQVDAPIHSVDGGTNAHFEKLRGNLRFPARNGAFFSGSLAVVVLMFIYLLWMVTQLRYVFRSLSRRLPFVPGNARRIRWVGLAVIFGEIGRAAIVYFWSYYTSLHFTVSGLRFAASADVSPITIVSGLAILVIAEVFQEGAQMQEDQSLTI